MGLIKRPRSDDLVSPFPIKRWDHYNNPRVEEFQAEGTQAGGAGGGGTDFPFPVSAITGWTKAVGDGTDPAYIQLLNPIGSTIRVAIYEFYVSFITHATGATIFAKKTASPVTLVSPLAWSPQHMNPQDISAIQALLYGGADGGSVIPEGDAHWYIPALSEEGQADWMPFSIREPLVTPVYLNPGEALEISADTNSTGTSLRAWTTIDQETI